MEKWMCRKICDLTKSREMTIRSRDTGSSFPKLRFLLAEVSQRLPSTCGNFVVTESVIWQWGVFVWTDACLERSAIRATSLSFPRLRFFLAKISQISHKDHHPRVIISLLKNLCYHSKEFHNNIILPFNLSLIFYRLIAFSKHNHGLKL